MPNLPGPGLTRGAVLAVALAAAGCANPASPTDDRASDLAAIR